MNPNFDDDDDAPHDAAGATPLRQRIERMRDRLARQEAQAAEMFAALRDDVTRLAEQLDSIPQAVPARPGVEAAAYRDEEAGPGEVRVGRPQSAAPAPRPAFDFAAAVPSPGETAGLEQAILGPELSEGEALREERGELLRDMLSGDPSAMALSGAILLFRSAGAERMPQLLKDIGEAWYGWRPHTADGPDELRDELTGWLESKCAQAGVPNSIELVRPGDRYDSKRHHARQPGVEVVEVAGWVVLRDNGKIYTKAAVSVK